MATIAPSSATAWSTLRASLLPSRPPTPSSMPRRPRGLLPPSLVDLLGPQLHHVQRPTDLLLPPAFARAGSTSFRLRTSATTRGSAMLCAPRPPS